MLSPWRRKKPAGKYPTFNSLDLRLLMSPRKLNTSPSTVEDPSILKKMLTEPPLKKIDLHFPLGLEVTARNLKGVTIKDALDAIHKQFKKKVGAISSTYLSSDADICFSGG